MKPNFQSAWIITNSKAIIYLQFNSVRLLVLQLVEVDEIEFDTDKIVLINTKHNVRLALS